MPNKRLIRVSRARWLVAQELEKRGIESADYVKEWLRVRRLTWPRLVDSMKGEISLDDTKRILEIGGGATSIFLAIRKGERYVVDPTLEHIFQLYPFVKEAEEYKGVNFIDQPIEEAAFDKQFALIFMINVLDHVAEPGRVADKIDKLLAPLGSLVVAVDCYADPAVGKIMTLFDVDIPHPHHFVADDIVKLFPSYKLIKQDNEIWKVFNEPLFRGQSYEIPTYRVDRLVARLWLHLQEKKGDALFALKYVLCYSFAMLLALLRRREVPIHPLKKERLFIFQKP